jgi:Co/Zn/Cd efflux system component
MEATPEKIDLEKLRTEFEAIRGVIDVHDLHVWDLRPGKTLMIAHVIAEKDMEREVLTVLTEKCRKLKIYHSTFQV